MLSSLRIALEPVIRRVLHLYWWFARGMTLGARAVVLNAEGRVFLIKHSYVAGWHLPGGGVETGETILSALGRELAEEGAIVLTGEPPLFGVYFNGRASRRDHVALYVVRDYRQGPLVPDREIVAHGYFAPDDLPPGTSGATRRRLAEVIGGQKPALDW